MYPTDDFLAVGPVADDSPMILVARDDDVVENAAILTADVRIVRSADVRISKISRAKPVEKTFGVGSAQAQASHVRYVEYAARRARVNVFFCDADK